MGAPAEKRTEKATSAALPMLKVKSPVAPVVPSKKSRQVVLTG